VEGVGGGRVLACATGHQGGAVSCRVWVYVSREHQELNLALRSEERSAANAPSGIYHI
jgi:hypothetical protein